MVSISTSMNRHERYTTSRHISSQRRVLGRSSLRGKRILVCKISHRFYRLYVCADPRNASACSHIITVHDFFLSLLLSLIPVVPRWAPFNWDYSTYSIFDKDEVINNIRVSVSKILNMPDSDDPWVIKEADVGMYETY